MPAALGLEVVDGRSFSKAFATDTSAVLVNETAVRQMNLKDPIGQYIETKNWKGTIVGVLKDFHFESLHNTIGPVIINCRPDWTWNMYVKMDSNNDALALKSIKDIYGKFAPGQILNTITKMISHIGFIDLKLKLPYSSSGSQDLPYFYLVWDF